MKVAQTPQQQEGECYSLQSCLIPCDPMDCSPTGSSVHGILQARILERFAISFSSIEPRSPAVGGGFFLFYFFLTIKVVLNCFSDVRLFATLWTVAWQALLFMPRTLEWVAMSFSRDLPDPGIQPSSLVSPASQADSLPTEPPGKSKVKVIVYLKIQLIFKITHKTICGS